jgi:hypothetical protein
MFLIKKLIGKQSYKTKAEAQKRVEDIGYKSITNN